MDSTLAMLAFVALATLLFAWVTGARNVSSAVGASVALGKDSSRQALALALLMQIAGVITLALPIASTFFISSDHAERSIVSVAAVDPSSLTPFVAVAVAASLLASVLLIRLRLFVSITYALLSSTLVALWLHPDTTVNRGDALFMVLVWCAAPLAAALCAYLLRRSRAQAHLFVTISTIALILLCCAPEHRIGIGALLSMVVLLAAGREKQLSSGIQRVCSALACLAIAGTELAAFLTPGVLLSAAFGGQGFNQVVLALGLAMVLGLLSFGSQVIEHVGNELEVNVDAVASAELATALVIVIAAQFSVPLSGLSVLLAAYGGVGFARGVAALDLSVLWRGTLGPLLIVPIAGGIAALLIRVILF